MARGYGYTFSDVAQRFVPNLLLEAFPDRPVTIELARSVLNQMEPTVPFVVDGRPSSETVTTGLSASGARIRGDDYQHLFAWIQVLRAIQVGSDIVEIGIEDPEAGNADDVTVYRDGRGREYYQVKSSVEAREAASVEWLMNPSRGRRT